MGFCQRCGVPCHGQESQKPEARLMKRAKQGVCVDCYIVIMLQRLSNMHVLGAFGSMPECLRLEHVQRQFEAVMRSGNAEATPDEINWDRVIELWDISPRESGTLF